MKGFPTLIIALVLFLFLHVSCGKYEEDPDFPSTDFISDGTYLGEYWPTREWRSCAPDELGMDPDKLRELNEEIIL